MQVLMRLSYEHLMYQITLFFLVVAVCLLSPTGSSAQAKSEAEMWREDLATMRRETEATHANLFHAVSRQDLGL